MLTIEWQNCECHASLEQYSIPLSIEFICPICRQYFIVDLDIIVVEEK